MDFDEVVAQYHKALTPFANGNPEPVKALWSQTGDVVLANPFGPAVIGWPAVADALDYASSRMGGGDMPDGEQMAKFVTTDLGIIHEREHWRIKMGRDEMSDVRLRVTSTFRYQDDLWKLVHRHADPIDTFSPDGPLRQ